MRSIHVQKAKRYRLSRERAFARRLNARVFAARDGKLLLVRGKPDAARFFHCLAHAVEPSWNPVMPANLGFARENVEELTVSTLATAAHGIARWKQSLRACRKPATKAKIANEAFELETLERRLAQFHDWLRKSKRDGVVHKAPWLLDDRQEAELVFVLDSSVEDYRTPYFLANFARIVMWTSGQSATESFCESVKGLPGDTAESEARRILRASLGKLGVWLKRLTYESERAIQSELKEWIRQIPTRIVSRAQLSSKPREKTLGKHLTQLLLQCQEALRECQDNRLRIGAATAAIALNSDSAIPIPACLFAYLLQQQDAKIFQHSVSELLEYARQPSYERLMGAIAEFEEYPVNEIRFIKKQIVCGEHVRDIRWAIGTGLEYWFEDGSLRPGWARGQIERLKAAGIELKRSAYHDLFYRMQSTESRRLVAGFIDWVGSLPESVRTPRVCHLLETTLLEVYLSAIHHLQCFDELHEWLRTVKIRTKPTARQAVEAWTQKILHNQASIGQSPELPRAIRSLLNLEQRRDREYEYLFNLVKRDIASNTQGARWQYLRLISNRLNRDHTRKLARTLQDSYIHSAVHSLRHRIKMVAASVIGNHLADRFAEKSLDRLFDFASWIRKMGRSERILLDRVLEGHQQHGLRYKEYLLTNRDWLARARASELKIDAWLQPAPEELVVTDRAVRIEVSTDPLETFLMGTYFGTCLSLGSENSKTVLANAADANKHVLYMRDRKNRVLARQLICITKNFELLGFYCYLNVDRDNEETREEIQAAVATYCGQLASLCRIPLVDDGEPESLGDHFWYDDGSAAWHKAAHNAVLQSSQTSSTPTCKTDCLA